MHHPPFLRYFLPLVLLAALISGCGVLTAEIQPTAAPTAAPTQAPSLAPTLAPTEATASPSTLTDEDAFLAALLSAIEQQDTSQLESWMTSPFISGGWRADASDYVPADALKQLYDYYMGADNHLEVVKDADLKALMGDRDPLSYASGGAGVFDAVLVSGWGKDGRDEAVLHIAREADGTLKWQCWMLIQGGFSGARYGGVQLYNNETYGYRVYVPKGYEVLASSDSNVMIMAPGTGEPGSERGAAFIMIEPANGQTVEQITEQIKADLGSGFNIPPGTAYGLDKTLGIVLTGLPGQDPNRQLFAVYNDLLYHVMFVPDSPQLAGPYQQMEDLYAQIVNTWHFTK